MMPPAETALADEQVVARVSAGDRDAFRILFERHQPPLVAYLTIEGGDPALAEDLAQDAFLEAHRCLGDLADGRPFAPWLYRIAQQHRLRRVWRRRSLLRFLSLDAHPARLGLTAAGSRPDEAALYSGERDLVGRVLEGLAPGQRTALLLHDVAGLSVLEIAVVVGGSSAAAERQSSRARERFRARYTTAAGGTE